MSVSQVVVQVIPGTTVGYAVLRDADYEPRVVAIGAPYITPADELRLAARDDGWRHLVHSVTALTDDGERVYIEFFRRSE